jgi:branched-subunit amino acid aminotransferase/4-amino-4-deoxychorismate lyase
MSAEGALPDGLIETLLWTRVDGYFLRDGHLIRITNSAAALGFAFSAPDWDAALAQACADPPAAILRVRLILRADGAIETSTAPFTADPEGKVWRVGIAATRFDSRDPLLRHKTTRRELYEEALSAARGSDEVVFLNERDEVCEGARTNVFVERDCDLLTPPVSCGLLPGVLRANLLARGQAREKVLRLEDLRGEFFIGNSLRGFLRARLMDS